MVPIGASHISLQLQEIQSREREKKNKRTICLGLTQSARQGVMQHSAFPVCICRLTLTWISSETSTKLLGMPTYPDRSSSLVPTGLSTVRCRLPSRVTLRQLLPRVPLHTSLLLAFPYPLPVTPRPRAKRDKGIVCLAGLLHIVTPSHSKWQGLKPSDPLTLLTVDYGPEILRGEDADGLTQEAGTEFSCNSAVPGNSSDIQGIPQLKNRDEQG